MTIRQVSCHSSLPAVISIKHFWSLKLLLVNRFKIYKILHSLPIRRRGDTRGLDFGSYSRGLFQHWNWLAWRHDKNPTNHDVDPTLLCPVGYLLLKCCIWFFWQKSGWFMKFLFLRIYINCYIWLLDWRKKLRIKSGQLTARRLLMCVWGC